MVDYILKSSVEIFLVTPHATEAPIRDIDFIYKLKKCKNYVNEVAQQALMSAIKHLWYLTPKLIILRLFDDKVPIKPKSGVCRSLHSFPRLPAYTPGKPGHPNF